MPSPPKKIPCRRPVNRRTKIKVMGDKSPKANQKDARISNANARKGAAVAAKCAAGK